MDDGALELIVKPWWLSPPAFVAAMILAGLVTVAFAATGWFVQAFFRALPQILG